MRNRYGTLLVVLVVLVGGLTLALPGAGSGNALPLDNLDRGSWEPAGDSQESSDQPPAEPTPHDSPASLEGLESLHRAGAEGDGVIVGVIGQRFTDDQRSLGGAVAGSRRFGNEDQIVANAGPLLADGNHDTAVAEIVARTAPESELYLADIGQRTTPERYAEAVSWLLEREVDVVVDAGSYFPADADGMGRLNDVASDATEQGVVFVTSAGNYGNRHWAGTARGDDWVEFADGTPYNELGSGPVSGPSSLRLYWKGDAEFDLYLYRVSSGGDTLVAKSAANQSGTGPHSEAIDATLPSGRYYVAVRGDGGANGTELELFAANHDLAETSKGGGMVAPATAENVIAVGAADGVSGEARPYSSGGTMLDISAPDGARTAAAGELYGSSAAAPLVAGTVALMVSQNESLRPAQTQQVLERTAMHVDGRLYLDTVGAVDAVSSRELQGTITGERRDWHGSTAVGDGMNPVSPPIETSEDAQANESASSDGDERESLPGAKKPGRRFGGAGD